MNNLAINYYKKHYQNVKNYFNNGSLVAELIKNEKKNDYKDKFRESLFSKSLTSNSKIISFYDTSFYDYDEAITTFDDFFGFYKDILKLTEKFKDLFIIIKPAKPFNKYLLKHNPWASFDKIHKVQDIINKVKKNNKIYLASDAADTVSIMAYSDLVVTHCMSTPSCDVLASGARAIWYESGNRHKGVLFDHIPDLIIHGYNNLEKFVSITLTDDTSLKYNEYIEKNVKGVVEDYIDGNAVSRFRNLLTANS